jgi:O-antigen/teichoic acid export membrane protein
MKEILRLVSLAQDGNLHLRIVRKLSNLISHPLFFGSAIMVVGSNSINVLNYLYHFLMGRMLGPSFYGELASLISLMGLLAIIPSSLSLVIIKYISSAKDEKETAALIKWLQSNGLKASLLISFLILIISPSITAFLHIDKLGYLILIAVSFLFSIQTVINRSILQGLLKFKEMILTVWAEVSAKLVISLTLIYSGFRVGGAMLAMTIAVFLGWLITSVYLKDILKGQGKYLPNIKKMAIFSIPVLIQAFATTSLYSTDVILVKHFFTSHEAGIYASLSTLGKIIFFGTAPIGSVMFPLVSKRQSKGQEYKRIFIYSLLGTTLLAASIMLTYWLAPGLVISMLYGSAYLEASSLLIWFGIFITLFTLSFLIINYGLSLGRTSVVIFPLIAATAQIIMIWFFHKTLFEVIIISIVISALLLISLLTFAIWQRQGSASER